MITSFNPENKVQFEMYSHLFAKAYEDLAKNNKLTEAEINAGRFTSLDEYFAHMADLIGININYIMLPLDESSEGVFKIDANTRTITIPSQFSKCAAVQSDEMCEIAVFTIDRYFDFQDLDRVSICVQWINAAGEEGISHIQLKDLETFPGKLRFGWPLTSAITKTPGNVQFAVRFFKESTDENNKKKYDYLLNTLTNTIIVKSGLAIENPKIEEENVSGLFASFVSNSMNPSYPQPITPFFVAPGKDLESYGAIDIETNTLTLTAQAVAKDLGIISYEWMFIPADSENAESLKDREGYSINHQDWLKLDPQPKERDGSQKYYTVTKDGDGEIVAHQLYVGDIPSEEELYIMRTTLKIEDTEQDIVGQYYVNATNQVSVNTTTPSPSTKCVVPAPGEVEISKDLAKHMFIDAASKTTTLDVEIKNDPTKPTYSYQWSSTDTSDGELIDIPSGKDKKLIVDEPGWYRLHIDSKLNRKVKDVNSEICKVTNLPTAPNITAMYYSVLSNVATQEEIDKLITGESDEYSWTKIEDYENHFNINGGLGSIVVTKIETNLDDLNPLKTENLTYQWYVQTPDFDERPLNNNDISDNGYVCQGYTPYSNILVARYLVDNIACNFSCKITNTIQDKTAVTDSSDLFTFTIV